MSISKPDLASRFSAESALKPTVQCLRCFNRLGFATRSSLRSVWFDFVEFRSEFMIVLAHSALILILSSATHFLVRTNDPPLQSLVRCLIVFAYLALVLNSATHLLVKTNDPPHLDSKEPQIRKEESSRVEGFAFAHCTTCKAPYYLRVQGVADRKWRTLKFRFFVTRDIIFIFLLVQLVIASLAYVVYLIDGLQQFWFRLTCGFDSEISFYYICGSFLFFALLGSLGCFITCYDRRVRSDLSQPCRELCLCCCHPGLCADCHLPGTLCMWTDCTACLEGCASTAGECGCLAGAGEAGLPLLLITGLIVLVLFTVIGIFYSVLVATMVGQRIWQRHYHILAKRMLTKEYVVEDVDGETTDGNWTPPPLPPEHAQQLKELGLL
ncbi:hypothetical protein Syun_013677 [Stephania yunnanensis]|uniref:Uncharacterized protein n=1 Tax=Stephania yunnanensis TaxID=152371 RepID=A0AAP0P7U8_9MAGN